ncbi:MAG: TIGR00269 family protein [Methanomassiliicoccaceae archaeon]|nr:TIGR00269 family protein [Methanomassiliicoccaceae archaeon]
MTSSFDTMRCDQCSREAVTLIRYNGTHLCDEHFRSYVEKRVKKEIRKQISVNSGDTIAVAVSGGKDSMVTLHILDEVFGERKDVSLCAISIDEGIEGYRPPSLDIVRDFCKDRGIPLYVRSFSEMGMEMDRIASVTEDNSPCTYCGVFRRKLMNDQARSAGAKYLATGHNLDDMAQSIMMNFVRGDVERLARLGPHTKIQPGLIPRFHPLRLIPEKESLLYAIVSGIPFWDGECPYYKEALRNQYRDVVDQLEDRSPGSKFSILASYDSLRPMLADHIRPSGLHMCACGEPTLGEMCKACELRSSLEERIKGL